MRSACVGVGGEVSGELELWDIKGEEVEVEVEAGGCVSVKAPKWTDITASLSWVLLSEAKRSIVIGMVGLWY